MKINKIPFLAPLLFVITFFSCNTVSKNIKDPSVLKWEEDIKVFDSLNYIEPADRKTILVTGSSSVRRWDSIHSDLAPFRVMQRGYGGAKLSDFNHYAVRIIPQGTFRAIVVFVANDISGKDNDCTPEEMYLLYRNLISQVRRHNPRTPVFWIETTPTPSRWHVYPQVSTANELIREYCSKRHGLYFIETREVFINREGVPDPGFFVPDMLHLNRNGYLRWSTVIKESLESAGISSSS